jgi:hypothetical protein
MPRMEKPLSLKRRRNIQRRVGQTLTVKIIVVQEEETCKKMKYTKKPPVITLIEDDVEIVEKKVQDMGEDLVHVAEV